VAKYTGGGDPTKGCFAKGEAKDPNDWQFTNDAATVQGLAEEAPGAQLANRSASHPG
jgi:hypothetical protein